MDDYVEKYSAYLRSGKLAPNIPPFDRINSFPSLLWQRVGEIPVGYLKYRYAETLIEAWGRYTQRILWGETEFRRTDLLHRFSTFHPLSLNTRLNRSVPTSVLYLQLRNDFISRCKHVQREDLISFLEVNGKREKARIKKWCKYTVVSYNL